MSVKSGMPAAPRKTVARHATTSPFARCGSTVRPLRTVRVGGSAFPLRTWAGRAPVGDRRACVSVPCPHPGAGQPWARGSTATRSTAPHGVHGAHGEGTDGGGPRYYRRPTPCLCGHAGVQGFYRLTHMARGPYQIPVRPEAGTPQRWPRRNQQVERRSGAARSTFRTVYTVRRDRAGTFRYWHAEKRLVSLGNSRYCWRYWPRRPNGPTYGNFR